MSHNDSSGRLFRLGSLPFPLIVIASSATMAIIDVAASLDLPALLLLGLLSFPYSNVSISLMGTIDISILSARTGQSEVLTVDPSVMTVGQLLELSQALLPDVHPVNDQLLRDGRVLRVEQTLAQEGVQRNDMLVIQPPPSTAGGLDFSSLLKAAPPTASSSTDEPFVYYPSMNFEEAAAYNPHPRNMVQLLFAKEHLWKELHYHNPKLGLALGAVRNNLEEAVRVWQQYVVQGSIQKALLQTQHYHRDRDMQERLQRNPHDAEAVAYFRQQDNKKLVQQQYLQMMEEYPESLSKVLMLYIPARINGHEVQAFCDSGAQMTIMSKKVAMECGIFDMLDDRFQGIASGVGTGKILGRIHLVQLQLQSPDGVQYHFHCTITVMDDAAEGAKDMPFLLGLDMMKRHQCQIDLEKGVLRFRIPPTQHLEVAFLHEKDLDESQGGTKGFDAALANAKWMQEEDEEEENKNALDES